MYSVVSMGTVGKAAPTRAQWPDLLPAPVCLSFVMVNSVAMEGDGCSICSEAEAELRELSRKLNCSREVGDHWNRIGLCARVFQRCHSCALAVSLPVDKHWVCWVNRVTSDQQVQGSSLCEGEQRLPFSAPVLLQVSLGRKLSPANHASQSITDPL